LCVDGGITEETIGKAASTGAHIIVSGSAVFKNGAIGKNCRTLNELISKGTP
jgi:pentose-5-phosphate-3-epimerase